MRLKKTLYAVAMFVAVASMVLPSVGAQVRGPGRYALNRSFAHDHHAQLLEAQNNYRSKPRTPRGDSKPLPNNGLLSVGTAAAKARAAHRPIDADASAAAMLEKRLGASAKAGDEITQRLMHPQPILVTPELRKQLQLRPEGAVTETAASRQARLTKRFADRKKGLVRGAGAAASAVLPGDEVAEDAALSALGFVGFAGTEDFFDEAVLLGDLDGVHNLRNNFNSANAPRELVDRQAKVEDDVLLPDETYTATVISGHNARNGFSDFNVFYTATSAGFINILGDSVCDGDLLADTVIGVVQATDIVVDEDTGRTFSNSASITGLAVNTDAEYDGDLATDEIVWFTVFDPEFGQPAIATSALCYMEDSDGDDIPDNLDVHVYATSTSISVAGVAVDSFGDVYWHLTDRVIGRVLKTWDTDEDRFPDTDFSTYNFPDDKATTAAAALDFMTAADAVDMTVDRYDSLYLQVSGGIGAPQPAGLGVSAVVSYTDRCGDFDSITGFIPRQDQLADTSFRVFAADQDVAQPAGAGTAPPTLVIPELQIDYAGAYRGLAADWDDNIYVAIGAVPAGQAGDPSPFTGSILRIPDNNCDRVGDAVDLNGNSDFGEANDYRWVDAPLNPPELTPNGINGIHFGPLVSLERVGRGLGDDDGIGFRFDDFDGPMNNVAGGASDLLRVGECDDVGTNEAGGTAGFEWLFCNTAWTGFRLGSNGNIVFRNDPTLAAFEDPLLLDFSPTVVDFLSSDAPQVAPLWTDLDPNEGGQFSLHHLGFAATDAFIIQAINVPGLGHGGVGVGTDVNGLPKRGQVNSFDVTFYDDQDAWDDVTAEEEQGGTNDTTNLDQTVNDDDDGVSFPAGISLRPEDPTRILDRNGDGDVTDENLAFFAQEGVGRTVPEQGPFKLVYHQVEVVGTAGQPVLVGFTTGADTIFNTGTIPPGLCETNLSAASPAPDNPFFMNGAIGMGTEPSLYEYFDAGSYGSVNPNGTINPSAIDVDLRQQVSPDCITRPERFLDTTSADCLLFKGSNIPVGLFCQTIDVTAIGTNTDPFLAPANLQINGFLFPMPTTGENAVCPQFCGQTAPLCRAGKSVTYDVVFEFDENGDGIVDATIPFSEPDVVVTSENQINLTIDFSQTGLCGGNVTVSVIATYGFGDDNRYFESRQLDSDAALETAPVQLVCTDAVDIGVRAPVVLSIAPDTVDCDHPDDPDNVEDVQIAGLCFQGDITSAFLSLSPDGSDPTVALTNIVNVQTNIITATVPLSQLTERDTPYYVFVVRGDGVRSTNYPNPLGFDVTFTCVSTAPPPAALHLTTCKVVRVAGGKFVLQVNGVGFVPNDTVVLLGETPCRKNKYPSRFISPSDGTTTRINCSGGIKRLLPAVVRVKTVSTGQLSDNSLNCDFSN